MDYTKLTVAQQRSHIEKRIAASEADHFTHSTTLRLFRGQAGTSAVDAKVVEDEEKLVAQLEQAIKTLKEMLLELPDVAPADRKKPPSPRPRRQHKGA